MEFASTMNKAPQSNSNLKFKIYPKEQAKNLMGCQLLTSNRVVDINTSKEDRNLEQHGEKWLKRW